MVSTKAPTLGTTGTVVLHGVRTVFVPSPSKWHHASPPVTKTLRRLDRNSGHARHSDTRRRSFCKTCSLPDSWTHRNYESAIITISSSNLSKPWILLYTVSQGLSMPVETCFLTQRDLSKHGGQLLDLWDRAIAAEPLKG